MPRPKLIVDTSACSKIARSPHRKIIESHLGRQFKRVLSVQTFWELLQQIEGGDGSHFSDDKEVLRVAAGGNQPSMLPNPVSFIIRTLLKRVPPAAPVPPAEMKNIYRTIMKARSREELYSGVPVVRGLRQVRRFVPEIVREQQDEGERWHVERFKRARRKGIGSLPPDQWAQALLKNNSFVAVSDGEAREVGKHLDAAYRFDMHLWKNATVPKKGYNPVKNRNDWTDMQQLIYLCDPDIHLLTADKGICRKIATSDQRNRVLYLPDYLDGEGLTL